ncbi:MAG TPA: hypothetical protein VFE53_06990 [Mucilaginibacter sp.]|jgi:hypothetical protein|nr:hypothetical protein [Mucilaginibacter sp.]
MSLNFFEASCQEPPLNVSFFGLCDDQNGAKAYTNIHERDKWIATVKNEHNLGLVFTAIDKCVIKDNEYPGRGRCDGMLTTDGLLYLVELNNTPKDWLSDTIEQLESTIQFFMDNHDLSVYKHKKAFACNKMHRHFQEIDNELNLRFFRKYRFRIDVQAEIIVV